MEPLTQFVDPTAIVLLKLVLAIVLGAVIGTERALFAHQAAGMRTFGLVALGSCLFIVTANYVDTAYLGIVNFDPMRMAAAVVTGIGFIGGGLIIFRGESLHGVTTAAGLWFSSGIGIAVGFGMYSVAIFATVFAIAVLSGMWYLENRFKSWFQHFDAGSSSAPSAQA